MSLKASFLYVFRCDERWKIPEESTWKEVSETIHEESTFPDGSPAEESTFPDGSPAHSESVDTKTRPGKRGKPERGQKRCGMVVTWACGRRSAPVENVGNNSVGANLRRRKVKSVCDI